MRGIDMAIKEVRTVPTGATLTEAAEAMRDTHVGALVVTDEDKVAGIVTDRDMVLRGIADKVPLDGRIDSIMTEDPVTIDASKDLDAALAVFNEHAFRRLPVTRDGELVGIVTVDDLMILLAYRMSLAARPIVGETLFPSEERAAELAIFPES